MASTSCQRSGVMVLLYLSQAPQKSEQGRVVRRIQREPKRMSGNRPSGDAGAFPPAGNVMRFQPVRIEHLLQIRRRSVMQQDGSAANLEEMFDPDRLKPHHVPGGWKGPGVTTRAILGHLFGLSLTPADY